MSVVAEDPTMVKYLLDQGVKIHERCYGNFFCPEDQKASRNDSMEHELVDVKPKTNYQGYKSTDLLSHMSNVSSVWKEPFYFLIHIVLL